ncbi:hypothetical protein B8W69_00400 [Mycobacterium vulneris]|uniref:DUF7229 domain-containing protein n=1 Tax=Mycolicibacterium vulneris TaxID=547163 RepID=A0A1X2LE84_9MYCO|nr:hypothetical protein [Mycolicibacterium vulneris]OSC32291.1 hypothetical protein B8W69_00400 [Mycolicibacterium vulneris]
MSTNLITQITGLEPTYSVREAAVLLGRSYSWLDQRLRHGEFVQVDGTILQPLRSPGRYRYLTFRMVIDIAACCYRRRWYSFDQLNSVFHVLAVAAYRDAGDHGTPARDLLKQLSSRMAAIGCEDALSTAPPTVRK